MIASLPDRQLADQALALTRRMLSFAQAGDWESVAETISPRDAALTRLFERACEPGQLLSIEATLRAVAQSNEEIVALGRESRDDIAARLNALSRGRNAARRYDSTQKL